VPLSVLQAANREAMEVAGCPGVVEVSRSLISLGISWSLMIKTTTGNRLTTTTRTLLDVATKQMKSYSRNTTIVTLRLLEGVLLVAVRDTFILLRIDDKPGESLRLLEVSLPTFLPVCAAHKSNARLLITTAQPRRVKERGQSKE
jgi:hypothetical protein